MQHNTETIQKILARTWSPDSWQSLTASQQPIYPDDAAVRRVVDATFQTPAAGNELGSRESEAATGRRRRRQFLLAARWRLFRANRRLSHRIDRSQSQSPNPDEFCADLTGPQTDHPRRSRGRSIRQAPFVHHRNARVLRCPCTGATTSIAATLRRKTAKPDPELLIRGYERAALTLNFIRSLDRRWVCRLASPPELGSGLLRPVARAQQFHSMVQSIVGSLKFMESMLDRTLASTRSVDVFTSHEASAFDLRTGTDPNPSAADGLVQPECPFSVAWKSTCSLHGCARRIFSRH